MRSLFANMCLVLGAIVFGTLAIVTVWLPPRGGVWWYRCARAWSRLILWSSGARLEVEHEQKLDRSGCYIFLSNHQSLYDIPVLLLTLPSRTVFMAKRSLFRIPIFGWSLSVAGFIPVDRGDSHRAKEAFVQASRAVTNGGSLLMFPEETRSEDGSILPFKRGGFLIAIKTRVPVVPIGISGTRSVRPKGSWSVHPGLIRVRYGQQIDVEGVRKSAELAATVRAEIVRLAGAPGDPGAGCSC